MREPRLVNWRPRSSMRRGAKSKGFMHAQGLACPSRSRIKDLQCQRNLPPPGGRRGLAGDIRGWTLLPLRQGRGTGGRFFNRDDGAAIAAAARDHLTAIERQLEVAVRTWLEPGDTGQIDQPRPVYPHDAEFCQPRFLGRKRAADQMVASAGETVFDVVSRRADPENVAGLDPDARRAVAEPDQMRRGRVCRGWRTPPRRL